MVELVEYPYHFEEDSMIMSVYPPQADSLRNLELFMSLTGERISTSRNDFQLSENSKSVDVQLDVCKLVNVNDNSKKIKPVRAHSSDSVFQINFGNEEAKENECYTLVCESPFGKKTLFLFEQENKYCFKPQKKDKCNAFAKGKTGENGKCVCPAPYTGEQCDQCQGQAARSWESGFAVCSQQVECSGFGSLKGSKCDC
jgi:hypothetical protein